MVPGRLRNFPRNIQDFLMFGTLPAYGFFCRHVTGLTLDNIDLSYKEPNYRPALFLSDAKDSRISDLNASCEERTESVIVLENSKNLLIRSCFTSKKSGVLATISNASHDINFVNNRINSNETYKSDGSINNSEIIVK